MVHFTTLILTAFCALSTATQGSMTETPALANSPAGGSTHPQATTENVKDERNEKKEDHRENKGNGQKHDQKGNAHNDHQNENHENKDNKGHGDHKENQGDHKNSKHMGHQGKPERFRWVDGDFGDFYRCPSLKAHCHNGNRRFIWEDHSKRCWIKYESGDECCYSFTQNGCHMFRKETIDTC